MSGQAQNLKTKKFTVIIILLIGILILIFYILRPIGNNELTKKELIGEKYCFMPSSSLESRCNLLGGEIKAEMTAAGIGPVYTIGCFPKGETQDSGKKCLTDYDCSGNNDSWLDEYCKLFHKVCEGICIGSELGPIKKDNNISIHSSCSKFLKPYFISKERITLGVGNDGLICGNE